MSNTPTNFPMAALASLALTATASAQLSPEEALKSFVLADDSLRVELVAAEPLVESPCALAFDERGRLFVAENRGYPGTANLLQGCIALLEDTDGDGRMDKRTVFADGLTFPNGVMPWRGGIIVTCAPDVLYFKDTDGDGRADERKVLLTGFATSGSTQLRVNCPTLGPDGWIYLAAGLSGGEITSPDHPERAALKMSADVRFHPDTFEVENTDGRSQYGMSFDKFGRRFICMNRVPVQHVVLSAKVLARNPHLAFSETVQDCSERTVKTGLRGGGDGVRLFPISQNLTTADSHAGTFSAACGIHIWRGGALPEQYRGCAFTCDPTGNLVHVDRMEPRGVTFSAVPMFENSQREFLASRDDWHRPVFLASGSDGALYVCDMYRKTIEHPDYLPEEVRKRTDFESGREMGRIWRVIGKDIQSRTSKIRQPMPEAIVELGRVIALGDERSAKAAEQLAAIALRTANDRWMRAAILSGVAGREPEFLRELLLRIEEIPAGASEFMPVVGRGMPDLRTVRAVMNEGRMREHGLIRRADDPRLDFPLILGFVEAHGAEPLLEEASRNPIGVLPLIRWAVLDANHFREARIAGVRVLGHLRTDRGSFGVLVALLDREGDADLRREGIEAIARFDEPEICGRLLAANLWASYSPALREVVLNSLLARYVHLGGVLTAVENGALAAGALNSQRRALFLKHKDPAIRERAEKLLGTVIAGDRAKAFEDAKGALALVGRAEHGREIFKTHCAICHRLEREGVAVGPDLLDIRSQPKESILFHIVVPDAEIAPAFTAYVAETKDGRALAGVLVAETSASVLLRMPGGADETLLRSNLTKLEALPNSLMPAGLDAAMSKQDLADLLAFLKGEK